MSLYEREWHFRRPVMEATLVLLSDFKKRSAQEIFLGLPRKRLDWVTPKMVSSILDSEGRRYVRKLGSLYFIREYELDPELSRFEREWENRKAIMENALGILRDRKPRNAKQIIKERARRYASKSPSKRDKSEVNSVLFSEGERYSKYDKYTFEHRIVP